MPGYFIHFAVCMEDALKNRSFVCGVEAPDMLKKHLKLWGIKGARIKYESLKTSDMPDYHKLAQRVQQKEWHGSLDGTHYGVSSSPGVKAFWNSLSEHQKSNPFYRGYVWHLLTDAIMYGRLNIDAKFQQFLDANQGHPNLEELKRCEIQKLHADWDKTNVCVRDTYPKVSLPSEIEELGIVHFAEEGELVYVTWPLINDTIDYLRTFDPVNGDMDVIIKEIMNNI